MRPSVSTRTNPLSTIVFRIVATVFLCGWHDFFCFCPVMFSHLPRTNILLFALGLSLFTAGKGRAQAPDGKSLFQTDCGQCHNPISVVVGPALKGVTQRVPDQKLLHDWIHNNAAVLASGNVYFNNLYNQYGRAPMNVFPGLTDPEIDAILHYVENYAQP